MFSRSLEMLPSLGAFVFGARDHSWRSCPKRFSGGKPSGKGKGGRSYFTESIFMIRRDSEPIESEGPLEGVSGNRLEDPDNRAWTSGAQGSRQEAGDVRSGFQVGVQFFRPCPRS